MASTETKSREDGRRPLLVYLDPALILQIKKRALEENKHAYLIVEEILKQSLASTDE